MELRIELPREISKARAHGDLSENAEYHAAKERQGMVNARLGQLRARLRELSMVDMSRIPRDQVGLGSTVTVLDLDQGRGDHLPAGDQRRGGRRARAASPPPRRSAAALLGKQVGDTVKIQIPGGVREMEITQLITIHDDHRMSLFRVRIEKGRLA